MIYFYLSQPMGWLVSDGFSPFQGHSVMWLISKAGVEVQDGTLTRPEQLMWALAGSLAGTIDQIVHVVTPHHIDSSHCDG